MSARKRLDPDPRRSEERTDLAGIPVGHRPGPGENRAVPIGTAIDGATLGRPLALPADNPLSTRVIVNRIWQGHFGRGLVGISGDFGRLGELPAIPNCSTG